MVAAPKIAFPKRKTAINDNRRLNTLESPPTSKQIAALFSKLWRHDATLADQLAALSAIPHKIVPFGDRANNAGVIELAADPYEAVIEGITNAFDGVIAGFDFGRKKPRNVEEALSAVTAATASQRGKPSRIPVQLFLQSGLGNGNRTLMIFDTGCGIPANKMPTTILGFGSTMKPLDPLAHGNYGQGGASLLQHSTSSMIISKVADEDTYTFTLCYRHAPDDGLISYVYVTDPNGKLFTLDASHLTVVNPVGTVTRDDVWHASNCDAIMLPPHGVVRRMFGIDIDYHSNRHNFDLLSGIQDRLFGTAGEVLVFNTTGNHARGQHNIATGRRFYMNDVKKRANLPTGALGVIGGDWTLLGHLPPQRMAVGENKVTVEAWIVDNKTGRDEKTGKEMFKQPSKYIPDGNCKNTARSIFLTLNGQTHDRMPNTIIARSANMVWARDNIIMEVRLDEIPLARRKDVMTSSRNRVTTPFHNALRDALVKYLVSHSAVLSPLRAMLTMPKLVDDAGMADHRVMDATNRFLSSPMIGRLLGFNGRTTGGTDTGGSSGPGAIDRAIRTERVLALKDIPTFVRIHTDTILRGATDWFVVRTDSNGAKKVLDGITVTLPTGFHVVETPSSLKSGAYSLLVRCDDTIPVGSQHEVSVRLFIDGVVLEDTKTVTVVDYRVQHDRTVKDNSDTKPTRKGKTIPQISWKSVDGKNDVNYGAVFPYSEEDDHFFTFRHDGTVVEITVNQKHSAITDHAAVEFKRLTSNGHLVFQDFNGHFKNFMVSLAMANIDAGCDGPETADEQRELDKAALSFFMTTIASYDADRINLIKVRAGSAGRDDEDE